MMQWVALGAMLGLLGCVAPSLRTAEITYYSKQSPVKERSGCVFVWDARLRTEAHGWSLPKSQLQDWLVDGIEARTGIKVVYSLTQPAEPPYITLKRAYIKHIATSMAGVAVLAAYTVDDTTNSRGNMTRLNWGGSSEEFSRVLSQALNKAIAQVSMASLTRHSCQQKSTDASQTMPVETDILRSD